MSTKGKTSEVGENQPTEKSLENIESLVDDVLDVPAQAPKSTLEKSDAGLEEVEEDETEEQSGEAKDQEEASEETSEETPEKKDVEDSEDEDVVPKSKHKKALENMQKRIDNLVKEREALREKEQSQAKTQDEKLAALSVDELGELRENVEDSIIDAKVSAKTDGEDVTARLQELKELKRAIDRTVKDAPNRFQKKQVDHFNAVAQEVVKDIPSNEDQQEVLEIAKRIFNRSNSMMKSETGQAEALAMAAEHFLEKKSLETGREQNSSLSKKVARLKQKTALDSKNRNANVETQTSRNMRDKAIKGTYYDKLDFVKSLVPDEFLRP